MGKLAPDRIPKRPASSTRAAIFGSYRASSILRSVHQSAGVTFKRIHRQGVHRVRALIASNPAHRHSINELERVAGLDRWSLARQFRATFGTSPTRFRILRQLDRVRYAILAGSSLSEAALAAGFADQSHMSRQFKLAYGLTPARWAAAIGKPTGRPMASGC